VPPSRGPEPLAGPEYRIAAQFRLDAGGRLQPAVPAAPAATIAEAARLYRARDHDAAAGVCAAILAADPRHFDALHLRGVLHLEAKRADDALVWLRQAAQERPDDPQVLFHLGFALLTLQRHDEAEAALQRARAGRPQDFDTLNNLGSAVAAQGRHAEAIGWFRLALALRPDAPPALFNLGRALLQCDAVEDAVPVLRAALAAAPAGTERQRRIDLHTTLNEALIRACRYREALAVLRAAPADVADAPAIVWNESLTLLMLGDYAAGWPKYECRFLVPDHDAPRPGAVTLALDAVAGRRVLVFPEQGRGDMLQFARYLPLLAARGAQVLVETYAELRPLFAEIDGVSTVVTPDEPPPPHDLQTALLSLPAAFATTLETIPAAVPYLRVPPAYAARWQAALGPRPAPHAGPSAGPSAGPPHAGPQMGPQMGPQHAGPQHVGAQHVGPQVGPPASARQAEPRVGPQAEPRVGLAWWGAQQIPRRSLPLAQLAPVLAVPRCRRSSPTPTAPRWRRSRRWRRMTRRWRITPTPRR
jgi:tetratricopeptide (TPR) repeat protein